MARTSARRRSTAAFREQPLLGLLEPLDREDRERGTRCEPTGAPQRPQRLARHRPGAAWASTAAPASQKRQAIGALVGDEPVDHPRIDVGDAGRVDGQSGPLHERCRRALEHPAVDQRRDRDNRGPAPRAAPARMPDSASIGPIETDRVGRTDDDRARRADRASTSLVAVAVEAPSKRTSGPGLPPPSRMRNSCSPIQRSRARTRRAHGRVAHREHARVDPERLGQLGRPPRFGAPSARRRARPQLDATGRGRRG
jgi:hypothetical protein